MRGWRTSGVRRARAFTAGNRAGATSIAAVLLTVGTVAAAALATDHLWLVDQRDVLKTATEAASVAATLDIELRLAANPGISDADLEAVLKPVAKRYVLVNLAHLAPSRLKQATDTLEIVLDMDRAKRTVSVTAKADIGGTLFSRHLPLLDNYAGPEKVAARAGVESDSAPVEVVLAVDLSGSMKSNLAGNKMDNGRINAVKSAAKALVATLDPNEQDRVAVGIVPYNLSVRLENTTAIKWKNNGWARYPAQRTYPVPYACTGCTPDPVIHTLPASPPNHWISCLDGHRIHGGISKVAKPTANALFTLPSVTPFAQSYFQPRYAHSYRCLGPSERPNGSFHRCGYMHGYGYPNQHGCYNNQPRLLPLSTDRKAVENAINALEPTDDNSYTTPGLLWGQRMLEPKWKAVWGGPGIHPVDKAKTKYADIRKAIVLLTDGEDTYCWQNNPDCSNSPMAVSRTEACNAVKSRGTEIFVIAAMPPNTISGAFSQSLIACSSQSDQEYPQGTRHPDTTYVFLNNTTTAAIEAAFAEVASQLRILRKIF